MSNFTAVNTSHKHVIFFPHYMFRSHAVIIRRMLYVGCIDYQCTIDGRKHAAGFAWLKCQCKRNFMTLQELPSSIHFIYAWAFFFLQSGKTELERIWKETAWYNSRYFYPCICLYGLGKTKSRSPGRGPNAASPKQEAVSRSLKLVVPFRTSPRVCREAQSVQAWGGCETEAPGRVPGGEGAPLLLEAVA